MCVRARARVCVCGGGGGGRGRQENAVARSRARSRRSEQLGAQSQLLYREAKMSPLENHLASYAHDQRGTDGTGAGTSTPGR